MSEISSGILIRRNNVDRLNQLMSQEGIDQDAGLIHAVNRQWMGVFLADEYVSEDHTQKRLLAWSQVMPLLIVIYAEDVGWIARILNRGRMEFEVEVQWHQATKMNLSGDCSTFGVFDLSEEVMGELEELFMSGHPELIRYEGFEKFKRLLEMVEFEWMSYGYLLDEVVEKKHEKGAEEPVISTRGAETDRDGHIRENLERLADALVPLVQEFLAREKDVNSLGFGTGMAGLRADFIHYWSTDEDLRYRTAKAMVASGLRHTLLPKLSEEWSSKVAYYDGVIVAQLKSLTRQFYREIASQRRDYYVSQDQLPRGNSAIELSQEIILASFPDRFLKSKRARRVGLGPAYGKSRLNEMAYLYPKTTDPNDVLWISYDRDEMALTGGFGRADQDFYVYYAMPCLGLTLYPYGYMLQSYAELEECARSFCKALETVYPYHVRLWAALGFKV